MSALLRFKRSKSVHKNIHILPFRDLTFAGAFSKILLYIHFTFAEWRLVPSLSVQPLVLDCDLRLTLDALG